MAAAKAGATFPKRQVLLMVEFQGSRGTLENVGLLALVVLHRMQTIVTSNASFGLGQVVVSRKLA